VHKKNAFWLVYLFRPKRHPRSAQSNNGSRRRDRVARPSQVGVTRPDFICTGGVSWRQSHCAARGCQSRLRLRV